MTKRRQYSTHTGIRRRPAAWVAILALSAKILLGVLYLQVAGTGLSAADLPPGAQVLCAPSGIKVLNPGDDGSPAPQGNDPCPMCLVSSQMAITTGDAAPALLQRVSGTLEPLSNRDQVLVRRIPRSCLRNRAPPLSA